MASTHDDKRTVIQADIQNLQRELEQLATRLKPMSSQQDQDDSMPPDTILIRLPNSTQVSISMPGSCLVSLSDR